MLPRGGRRPGSPRADGRIARIVNTLEWISFNAGPTLLEWMERRAPDTYQAFLAADRASIARLGHGNALAMPYHHAILPLSSPADRTTEIRWGMADFRRRFGREPEGMWLPETAVDDDTLDALAAEGIRFTVLAPHQVEGAPAGRQARAVSGPERAQPSLLFAYDGALAHDVAFGPLVRDADRWLDRLTAGGPGRTAAWSRWPATARPGDTITISARWRWPACSRGSRDAGHVTVENFASWLAQSPGRRSTSACRAQLLELRPRRRALAARLRLQDRSRARHLAGLAGTAPRGDRLARGRSFTPAIEEQAREWFADPWTARDRYGSVVGAEPEALAGLVRELARPGTDDAGLARAAEWLESRARRPADPDLLRLVLR